VKSESAKKTKLSLGDNRNINLLMKKKAKHQRHHREAAKKLKAQENRRYKLSAA
jgi:hypothetical protein